MRNWVLLLGVAFLAACVPAWAQNPTVSNVAFVQGPVASPPGTQAAITYDLASPGGNCTVLAMLSKDGGTTYPYAITSASGDIGTGVTAGTGKQILWNVATDYPNENMTTALIKVIAIVGTRVESVRNGTFTGNINNWATTGNWAYTATMDPAGAAGKLGGNNQNTLTQTAANQANALVTGTAYTVTYSVSSLTAGTGFRVSLGTANGTTRGVAGTYTENITCAGGTTITFTPMNNATRGVIDNVSIRAGANNGQANSASGTLNTISPTVTIIQKTTAPAQSDPTSTPPINFTATFSTSVSGFADGDATITGTAGGTKTTTVTGGPTTYNVAVTGMTSPGTVIGAIPAGVCWDALGNANAASAAVGDRTVTFNIAAPAVSAVSFTQEPAASPPGTQITINYNLASTSGNCTVEAMLSEDNGVTFPFSVKTATGDLGIGVTPGTGKQILWNVAADLPYAVNSAQAVVKVIAIVGASPECVSNGTFDTNATNWNLGTNWVYNPAFKALQRTSGMGANLSQTGAQLAAPLVNGTVYTVTYSIWTSTESVPGGGLGDLEVVLGGTVGTLRGAIGTYTETLACGASVDVEFQSNIRYRGLVDNVSVRAGAYNAQANSAAGAVSTVQPTVAIDQAAGQTDPTGAAPINFTAVFSKAVTNFATGDIAVTGTTAGVKTGTVSGSGTTYTVAVTGMASVGTVIADIPANVCWDSLGNGNTASTSTDKTVTYTYDVTPPAVPVITAPNGGADFVTNVAPLTLSGTCAADANAIHVNGSAAGVAHTPGNTTWSYSMTLAVQGANVFNVTALDLAVNESGPDTITVTFDSLAPAVPVITSPNGGASFLTNSAPLTLSGTCAADTSAIHVNGSVLGVTYTPGDTTWSYAATLGTQGANVFNVTALDAVANESGPDSITATFDSVAPTLTINGLGTTNDVTPVLSGTVGDNLAVATVRVTVNGHTYDALVSGGAWDADVTFPLAGVPPTSYTASVTATDTAGNTTTTTSNFTVDATSATLVSAVVLSGASPTNAASVSFDVKFGLGVSPVVAADFLLHAVGIAGAAITGVTGGGDTWTVTADTGTGDGTIRLDVIDRDTIIDIYSHPLGGTGLGNGDFSGGEVYVIDRTKPGISSFTSTASNPTNTTPIPVAVIFTEDVSGFAEGGVTPGSATLTDFSVISAKEYHFNLNPTADGAVTANIAADVAQDAAGNTNTAATQFSITYDSLAPTAPSVTGTTPTNNQTPTWHWTPGGGGNGTYRLDFDAAGSWTATTATLFTPGSNLGAGTHRLLVQERDDAGNWSTSGSFDISVDLTAPTVTVEQAVGQADPAITLPVRFAAVFDGPVTGFDSTDVIVGGSAGAVTCVVDTVDQQTWNIAVSGMVSDGTVTVSIPAGACKDSAGNDNAASTSTDNLVTYDGTPPTLSISNPSISLTKNGPVTYTVTYTGADSVTLADSDIIPDQTGTANGAVNVSGSGTAERTVTISSIAGTGAFGISIAPGTASDLSGNTAAAGGPSVTFDADNAPPDLTINALGTTNDLTPVLSGTASDNQALDTVKVTVNGHTYDALVNSGSWSVTVSDPLTGVPPTGYTASVTATDTVGNTTTVTGDFTVDITSPTTVDAVLISGVSPTHAALADFQVFFSADVSPVVPADFALATTGGISGASVTSVTVNANIATVTVNTGSGDGTIRLDVVDQDTILDIYSRPLGGTGLGNGDYSAGQAYTIDKTPPDATLTLDAASLTGADTVTFSVAFSESVGTSFDASDVTVTGTLSGTPAVSGSDPNYTVSVALDDPNADGTVGISTGAGVSDLAGNPYAGGASPLYTIANWSGFTAIPQDARTYSGDDHTFAVAVSAGPGTTTYQWKWVDGLGNPVHNVGQNSDQLPLSSVQKAARGQYWCEVVYDGTTHPTPPALLSVEDHLQITAPPVDGQEQAGASHTFTVDTSGGYLPLAYVWSKGSKTTSGADAASFTVSDLVQSDSGTYTVEVSDADSDILTASAKLTVSQGIPVAGLVGLGALAGLIAAVGARNMRKK